MFNKIEFSDLYKFLTSVGLVFIASSFLIPWLFMKQDIGILINSEDYNNLIQSSKTLTDKRIEMNLFVVKAIPFVSCGLFIIGSIIIYFGITNWKRKQKNVDETEDLKLTELRAQVAQLKPSEINVKAENEINEELNAKADDNNEEITKPKQPITKKKKEQLKINLLDMENLFFQKIIDYNTFDYQPKSNVKIANNREIDILLNAYDQKKRKDKLIEIKYLQNKLSMQLIRDSFNKFRGTVNTYTNATKRNVIYFYVIIYSSDIADDKQTNRFIQASKDFEKEIADSRFKLFIMNEKEAKEFDINRIVV